MPISRYGDLVSAVQSSGKGPGKKLAAAMPNEEVRESLVRETLNKSILDFSERGRQEAWFLPALREQRLTPLFAAARSCAAGSSELVQSFLSAEVSAKTGHQERQAIETNAGEVSTKFPPPTRARWPLR